MDVQQYQTLVKQQHIPRGSTMAVALPQALPGFVVGRSTLNGGVIGWDPSGIASEVHVDPDLKGGFIVDLTKISADAFHQATDSAKLKDAISIDDLRARASSVFRTFASPAQQLTDEEEGVTMPDGLTRALSMSTVEPLSKQSAMPAAVPAQTMPVSTVPNPFVQAEPLLAPPQAPPQPQQYRAPAQQQPRPQAVSHAPSSLFEQLSGPRPAAAPAAAQRGAGAPPTYQVTLEVKGSPVAIEAWYHEIIRREHVLVLVFDTSCVGYPRSHLRPTDSDIAVHITGSESIYLVQDPQIVFDSGGQEFKVLLIKSEFPYEVGPRTA